MKIDTSKKYLDFDRNKSPSVSQLLREFARNTVRTFHWTPDGLTVIFIRFIYRYPILSSDVSTLNSCTH